MQNAIVMLYSTFVKNLSAFWETQNVQTLCVSTVNKLNVPNALIFHSFQLHLSRAYAFANTHTYIYKYIMES